MNKKKITIIAAVVGILIIMIGVGVSRARRQFQAQFENLQTVKVERGSLIATIGGTGTVRANQSANLTWKTSGTVEDVNAVVGQDVERGLVLATLAQTSLPQNIILARADLAAANDALEDFYKAYEELGVAEAAKAVADARDALRDAEIRVANLQYTGGQQDKDGAYAKLVLAESTLKRAKTVFSYYENKPNDNLKRAQAYTQLESAQDAYDAALRTWNYLQGGANEIDLAQGQADLLVAKIQLEEALAELEKVQGGPSPLDVAAAQARVDAAQATLNLALLQAPFDGTITVANPKPGDQVSTGAEGFRLDDLSRLVVDVDISEVDINRVNVGQDAVMIFDAILAKEYHGIVLEVGQVGTSDQGIVNFRVTVEITDPDPLVKPGMTAAVNIVVSEVEDALLVPNRAVRLLDGQRVVYILSGMSLKPVEITLGSSSDTHSQVMNGDLKDGDEIVLNPPAVFQPGPGGPGGGRRFGGN